MDSHTLFCGHWKNHTGPRNPEPRITYNPATDEYRNSHNCLFRQLPQDVPALKPLYPSQWELQFNSLKWVDWTADTMHVAFAISAAYLLFVFVFEWLRRGHAAADKAAWEKSFGPTSAGGPAYPGFTGNPWTDHWAAEPLKGTGAGAAPLTPVKKDRKSSPKFLLSAWNLLLAVFSAVGFVRTMPHLVFYGWRYGFYASVCAPAETSFGQGAAGLWTMLFIFSKVPELVDTAFLILTKKRVDFLHWYHHFTVLLYCWHSYATRSSAGLYFVAMNYGVHAIMYLYYFLTSCGFRPWWARAVTTLQISQMFVGMFVCVSVAYFKWLVRRRGGAKLWAEPRAV